jgi:hypothetical protein
MTSGGDIGQLPRAAKRLAATPSVWAFRCVWRRRPALIGLTESGRVALISDGVSDSRDYAPAATVEVTLDGARLELRLTRAHVVAFEDADVAADVAQRIGVAREQARASTPDPAAAAAAAPVSAWAPFRPWTAYALLGLALLFIAFLLSVYGVDDTNAEGERVVHHGALLAATWIGLAGFLILMIGIVAFAAHLGTTPTREMVDELLRRSEQPSPPSPAARRQRAAR